MEKCYTSKDQGLENELSCIFQVIAKEFLTAPKSNSIQRPKLKKQKRIQCRVRFVFPIYILLNLMPTSFSVLNDFCLKQLLISDCQMVIF